MTGEIPGWLPGHALLTVVDAQGRRVTVSPCMLVRLDADAFAGGRVPADMPEYDSPPGTRCHPDWHGGCPVAHTATDDGGADDA